MSDTTETTPRTDTVKRVLMIVTSHARLGASATPTGFWLEELAAPYGVFHDAGLAIDIASPAGGRPPADPKSEESEAEPVRRFRADREAMARLEATRPLAEVTESYDAYFVVGGHGVMWDLATSAVLASLLGRAHDAGKVIAAVCHGPAALVGVRDAHGQPIVRGRRVAAFSNEEEELVGLTAVVPFSLETRLGELGARYERGPKWTAFAMRDGNLVTGQNPQSSAETAREMIAALREAHDRPPQVAAPAGAPAVTVTLRLTAKDADAFRAHLLRVIPVTRTASGCRFSHSYQAPERPAEFLLVQGWDSLAQQQAYLGWRERRGDLALFQAQLAKPPVVDSFILFDS